MSCPVNANYHLRRRTQPKSSQLNNFKEIKPSNPLSDLEEASNNSTSFLMRRIPQRFLWSYYDDECKSHMNPNKLPQIRVHMQHLLIWRMHQDEWDNNNYKKKLQLFTHFKKYAHSRKILLKTRDFSFKSFHDNCLCMLKPFAAKARNKTRLHISLLGEKGEYHFASLLELMTPKLEELCLNLSYAGDLEGQLKYLDHQFCKSVSKKTNLRFFRLVSKTPLPIELKLDLFQRVKKLQRLQSLDFRPSSSFYSNWVIDGVGELCCSKIFSRFHTIKYMRTQVKRPKEFQFFILNSLRIKTLISLGIIFDYQPDIQAIQTLCDLSTLKTIDLKFTNKDPDTNAFEFKILEPLTATFLTGLHLSFQAYIPTTQLCQKIGEIVQENYELESLSIKFLSLSAQDTISYCSFDALGSGISQAESLSDLKIFYPFSRCNHSQYLYNYLIDELQLLKTIQLNISLEEECVQSFANFLAQQTQLESLDLSLNPFVSNSHYPPHLISPIMLQTITQIISANNKELAFIKLSLGYCQGFSKMEDYTLVSKMIKELTKLERLELDFQGRYWSKFELKALYEILKEKDYLFQATLSGHCNCIPKHNLDSLIAQYDTLKCQCSLKLKDY